MRSKLFWNTSTPQKPTEKLENIPVGRVLSAFYVLRGCGQPDPPPPVVGKSPKSCRQISLCRQTPPPVGRRLWKRAWDQVEWSQEGIWDQTHISFKSLIPVPEVTSYSYLLWTDTPMKTLPCGQLHLRKATRQHQVKSFNTCTYTSRSTLFCFMLMWRFVLLTNQN